MSQESFEDLVETFAFLDDWDDRYSHLIELGKAMPEMDDTLKSNLTKVDGCVSQVWIAPRLEGAGGDARLHFIGDSDAMIVRGLIAVLHHLLSGRRLADIRVIDIQAELGRLGLDQALSPQRSNGLQAMVARLRTLIAGAAKA